MESTCDIPFEITPQPDEVTCGASCLHSVYRRHGVALPLEQVIAQVPHLPEGGTLAVMLGLHALSEGFSTTLYTFDLQLFDPSWFQPEGPPIAERLIAQAKVKRDPKFLTYTQAYLDFLAGGGKVLMEDLSTALLQRLLTKGPLIVALSNTWLLQCARERPADMEPDDVNGEPAGHFVVVYGLDQASGQACVADPYIDHPHPAQHHYRVSIERLIGAIFLGVMTFDGKLLVIEPGRRVRNGEYADPADRQ